MWIVFGPIASENQSETEQLCKERKQTEEIQRRADVREEGPLRVCIGHPDTKFSASTKEMRKLGGTTEGVQCVCVCARVLFMQPIQLLGKDPLCNTGASACVPWLRAAGPVVAGAPWQSMLVQA